MAYFFYMSQRYSKKFELTNILLTIFYKIFQFSGKLLIDNKKETAPEFTDAVSFL